MSDSPVTHAPVTAQERPILDKFLLIRDKLLLYKQDKSTYVKSQDILPLYEEVIEQVHSLNDVRGPDHLVQNRVDFVLDDCLQLVSLFFMAIGRNNEAPAMYSMTSTITRLCEHLKEAAFYSKKDLQSLADTLEKMEHTLEKGVDQYSPYLLTRIKYRLEVCQALLQELRDFLSTLSPEMIPTWENLVSLLRGLAALNTRSKVRNRSLVENSTNNHQYNPKDLQELREKLLQVQATMKDGSLPGDDGKVGSGQDLVVPLLNRCLKFAEIIESKYEASTPD